MKIILKIERFTPGTGEQAKFQEYEVTVAPTDRLLDALIQVKQFQDGTLGFRKSCAHGVCGSDAMQINGKDGLACKTLIRDVAKEGDTVEIRPLKHLPVQRDLIVDQEEFFAAFRQVKPFLINRDSPPDKERIQSPEARAQFDDATNCILCASCYSACPVLEKRASFLGPAALTQGFRFNADSRDQGFEDRLPDLDHSDGVWACENHFECTRACPRAIKITKRINQTKREIETFRNNRGETVNQET